MRAFESLSTQISAVISRHHSSEHGAVREFLLIRGCCNRRNVILPRPSWNDVHSRNDCQTRIPLGNRKERSTVTCHDRYVLRLHTRIMGLVCRQQMVVALQFINAFTVDFERENELTLPGKTSNACLRSIRVWAPVAYQHRSTHN